jgi:hypothetical protein
MHTWHVELALLFPLISPIDSALAGIARKAGSLPRATMSHEVEFDVYGLVRLFAGSDWTRGFGLNSNVPQAPLEFKS